MVYLAPGKIMNLLWEKLYSIVRIFILVNDQNNEKMILPIGHTATDWNDRNCSIFTAQEKHFQKVSDIATIADPSFLVLAFPKLFCAYFNQTLASPSK